MAKTITLTFYNPKELWQKFCNWVFWPRRKKCVEWCDYYDVVLMGKVVDILQNETAKGTMSDETAERVEVSIRKASEDVSKTTAELMSEPF